jgi:hypothetical protein
MANARNGMPIQRGFEISAATLLGYMICCEAAAQNVVRANKAKRKPQTAA